MICRNCKNAFTPSSTNKREQEGIDTMLKYGYRQCKAARTPEEKARWITGGCECVYQERYLAKTGMEG